MGKYIKKTKTTPDVAVMDLSSSSRQQQQQQSSLTAGVLTRAKTKTLAAQIHSAASNSYLQLRSRRLIKQPPILFIKKRRQRLLKEERKTAACDNAQNPNDKITGDSGPGSGEVKEERIILEKDVGVEEACFGENLLGVEARERTTRESTPCSLIRDPETVQTPGSTTKLNTSSMDAPRGTRSSSHRNVPTAHEMDEFFTGAEEEQQRQFIEKYNFDPVNEKPLPGRYEWKKVDH